MSFKNKEASREYHRKLYAMLKQNPEWIAKKREQSRMACAKRRGTQAHKEWKRKWMEKPDNAEKHRAAQRARHHEIKGTPAFEQKRKMWRKAYWSRPENIAKAQARRKAAEIINPVLKLKSRLRTRLYSSLKGRRKMIHSQDLIGCTFDQLREWLQSKFKRGMAWNNYGTVWHVDHKVPCAAFDFSNPEQLRRAWHYSNLCPEFAEYNLRKGCKIIPCQPELTIQLT